jgi:hypothetical protein
MLAEMYDHLSDARPTHGLEIVFVSSDRDESSFSNYYQSMPWRAIPFDQLQLVKHALNMTYGVRGIPSLVVLDAVSGQVVVPSSQSRQEVANACRSGEPGIESLLESWLSRVPASTHELLSMLELSTLEETNRTEDKTDWDDIPYLRRVSASAPSRNERTAGGDLPSIIKMHFERLVNAGHDPNTAAATALKLAADAPNDGAAMTKIPGALDGKACYSGPPRPENSLKNAFGKAIDWNSASAVADALSTAHKYLKNAAKEPWEPKYRSFKLSNKVADTVTRVEGGWYADMCMIN